MGNAIQLCATRIEGKETCGLPEVSRNVCAFALVFPLHDGAMQCPRVLKGSVVISIKMR